MKLKIMRANSYTGDDEHVADVICLVDIHLMNQKHAVSSFSQFQTKTKRRMIKIVNLPARQFRMDQQQNFRQACSTDRNTCHHSPRSNKRINKHQKPSNWEKN